MSMATGVMAEKMVTFEQAASIVVPQATRSYMPVANGDLIRTVGDILKTTFGVDDSALTLTLGLSQKDQQMFGAYIVKSEALTDTRFQSRMMYCFRNSYNRSLSIAAAAGAHCWVCDNKQISGEVVELRKHTTNIWRDLEPLLLKTAQGAAGEFSKAMGQAKQLAGAELNQRQMFQLVGVAQGEGVLKPQQASVAIREIKEASHEEHSAPTAWSLYNAFTQGIKRGNAGTEITRHHKVQKFFDAEFALVN